MPKQLLCVFLMIISFAKGMESSGSTGVSTEDESGCSSSGASAEHDTPYTPINSITPAVIIEKPGVYRLTGSFALMTELIVPIEPFESGLAPDFSKYIPSSGIIIAASDVVLDFGGYSISASPDRTMPAIAISPEVRNAKICNGTISGLKSCPAIFVKAMKSERDCLSKPDITLENMVFDDVSCIIKASGPAFVRRFRCKKTSPNSDITYRAVSDIIGEELAPRAATLLLAQRSTKSKVDRTTA